MKKIVPLILLIYANILFAQLPCSSGIALNGSDDFISPENTDAINIRNVTDRTIEFWFKTDDITSRQVIYEEGGGTHSISIFLEDDRIYYTAYRNSADLSSRRRSFRSGDEDIEVGKWFHVAFVLEGGTTLKWYLNGIEQDSQAGLTVPSHSGDVNLGLSGDDIRFPSSLDSADWDNSSIGTSSSETYDGTYGAIDTADYNYSGNISLFRIWNVARTEAQIDDNKSDFLTSGTSLVAYSDQDRIYYVPNGATAISLTAFVALNTQSTTIPDTDAINLQNTRDRTIEFRFKATDMTTRQVLYEEGGNVNAIVAFIEAGRFYFSAYRNNAGIAADRRFFRSGDGDVVFNTWYHVAITLEDTDAGDANPPTSGLELKWYLDGVEQDSQNGIQIDNHNGDINLGLTDGAIRYPDTLLDADWSASSIGSSTSETYNGGETSSSDANNFSGDFDLFRIWNVARDQLEIDTNKDVLLTSETDLVAYQSGTQMNYQPNGGTSITESVDAVGVITWDGSDSNVWTTTTNWVGDTAPNATRKQKVAIPDGGIDPILTTEISVGFLTINTGVELIIEDGATLNVYYGLDNNGTITVENGGSLIYHNCQSAITGSGSFSINRNTPSYGVNDFYSYWSSPVIPSNSNIATVFPDAELIYRFNSDVANSDWVLHGTSDFSSGVGYAIQNEGLGGQLRNFQGKINEADVTVPVFDTSNLAGEGSDEIEWSLSGDNLVGNPFSSALSWDVVVRDSINKNINGTIYFWDQSVATNGENEVGDYKSYNATGGGTPGVTGNIGSGQAFFVKTDGNGSISFKPTHQVAVSNTQFYKSAKKKQSVINNNMNGRSWFSIHHKNKINTILIGFLKGATETYDRLYDGLFDTNQQELGFYSILPNGKTKASIQGLPKLFLEEHRVKLGYIVDKIGAYKIDINQEYINKDYHIFIIDKNTNTIQDLRKKAYNFNIDEIGENENRLVIIYKKSKVLDIEDFQIEQNKNFIAYVNNSKELIIDTEFDDEIISYTKIFDLQGREIASFKQKERKDISQLSTGIYIVKLVLNDNSTLSQKILFD